MLPSTLRLMTLPATRTLKMSPTPMSKISSAGVRESMQLKHHRQRVLALRRGGHLAAEVAGQPTPAAKPLVPVPQDLQDLRGRERGPGARAWSSRRTEFDRRARYLLRNPIKPTCTPRAGAVTP